MNHYVYEITNLINGKKYIGKRSCKCPIEEDKYIGSGTAFKYAVKKYGKENFKKEILQICENEEMAFEWEKVYIEQVKAYKNNNNYYNISSGGKGGGNANLAGKTEEELNVIREKLRNHFKERYKGEGNPFYGKKHSEETRKKLSAKAKLQCKGEGNPFYGKKHSIESKEKIGNFHKGNSYALGIKRSDETKKKLSESRKDKYKGINSPLYGKKISEEHRRKISEAHKNRSEDYRKKLSEANKGKKLSLTTRQKIGDALRGENSPFSIKVICLNTGEVFNNIKTAGEYYDIKTVGHISSCCKNKRNSAGKINGEPAKWMYYDEYLKEFGV